MYLQPHTTIVFVLVVIAHLSDVTSGIFLLGTRASVTHISGVQQQLVDLRAAYCRKAYLANQRIVEPITSIVPVTWTLCRRVGIPGTSSCSPGGPRAGAIDLHLTFFAGFMRWRGADSR